MEVFDTMKDKLGKKGQAGILAALASVAGLAILFVVIGLVTGVAGQVTDSFRDTLTADTLGDNMTENAENALVNFSSNYATMGTIAGAAILILIVVGAFGFFLRGRMVG